MTRYTKFNEELGRYVVHLLLHEDGLPIVGFTTLHPEERDSTGRVILSPQLDALFGEVVDRLAELENAAEMLEKTRAVHHERGRWSYQAHRVMSCHTTGYYFCSLCGYGWERLEGVRPTNYCPHCGADMREEADR